MAEDFTQFLNLIKPRSGENWGKVAQDINDNFDKISSHDHSSGRGRPIPVDGLNINKNLPMNNFGITSSRFLSFIDASSEDLVPDNSFFRVGDNFFYKNNQGFSRNLLNLESPVNITSVELVNNEDSTSKLSFTLSDGSVIDSNDFIFSGGSGSGGDANLDDVEDFARKDRPSALIPVSKFQGDLNGTARNFNFQKRFPLDKTQIPPSDESGWTEESDGVWSYTIPVIALTEFIRTHKVGNGYISHFEGSFDLEITGARTEGGTNTVNKFDVIINRQWSLGVTPETLVTYNLPLESHGISSENNTHDLHKWTYGPVDVDDTFELAQQNWIKVDFKITIKSATANRVLKQFNINFDWFSRGVFLLEQEINALVTGEKGDAGIDGQDGDELTQLPASTSEDNITDLAGIEEGLNLNRYIADEWAYSWSTEGGSSVYGITAPPIEGLRATLNGANLPLVFAIEEDLEEDPPEPNLNIFCQTRLPSDTTIRISDSSGAINLTSSELNRNGEATTGDFNGDPNGNPLEYEWVLPRRITFPFTILIGGTGLGSTNVVNGLGVVEKTSVVLNKSQAKTFLDIDSLEARVTDNTDAIAENVSDITILQARPQETPATIKTKYESNSDTNAYTDAEKTKLAGLTNDGGGEGGTDLSAVPDSTAPDNASGIVGFESTPGGSATITTGSGSIGSSSFGPVIYFVGNAGENAIGSSDPAVIGDLIALDATGATFVRDTAVASITIEEADGTTRTLTLSRPSLERVGGIFYTKYASSNPISYPSNTVLKFSYTLTDGTVVGGGTQAVKKSVVFNKEQSQSWLDIEQTYTQAEKTKLAGLPTNVVTDHGGLTGLADDDHPHYLNNTRGDARYAPLSRAYPQADANKLSGIENNATADQSPTEIKDALEGLSGTSRLDASAIKNLPTGGGGGGGANLATQDQFNSGSDILAPTVNQTKDAISASNTILVQWNGSTDPTSEVQFGETAVAGAGTLPNPYDATQDRWQLSAPGSATNTKRAIRWSNDFIDWKRFLACFDMSFERDNATSTVNFFFGSNADLSANAPAGHGFTLSLGNDLVNRGNRLALYLGINPATTGGTFAFTTAGAEAFNGADISYRGSVGVLLPDVVDTRFRLAIVRNERAIRIYVNNIHYVTFNITEEQNDTGSITGANRFGFGWGTPTQNTYIYSMLVGNPDLAELEPSCNILAPPENSGGGLSEQELLELLSDEERAVAAVRQTATIRWSASTSGTYVNAPTQTLATVLTADEIAHVNDAKLRFNLGFSVTQIVGADPISFRLIVRQGSTTLHTDHFASGIAEVNLLKNNSAITFQLGIRGRGTSVTGILNITNIHINLASAVEDEVENIAKKALTEELASLQSQIGDINATEETAETIKTKYESNANTNAYTDGEKTKLSGIENNATADQTAAQIKTAYESNANTNAYTDGEKTKLSGIENNATADQTAAQIKTAYESNSNTNAYTDGEKTKLSGIQTGAQVNIIPNWDEAQATAPSYIQNKPTIPVFESLTQAQYDAKTANEKANPNILYLIVAG